jgi:hypothetical protein
MAICKKCDIDFIPQKGLKSFCSLSCRNTREWKEESRQKVSITLNKYYKDLTEEEKVKFKNNNVSKESETEKSARISKMKLTLETKLLASNFDELCWDVKRKRVIKEQHNKCNKCKIDSWLGEKIILEIDHIDGDNKNNLRENLEAICPNCHSLTKTWRGRNKKKGNRITEEELINALLHHNNNIRQTLISLNLAPKGNNYSRCKKILQTLS